MCTPMERGSESAYSPEGGWGGATGHARSLTALLGSLRALPVGLVRVAVAGAGAFVDCLLSTSEGRASPRLPLASQDSAGLPDALHQVLEQLLFHVLSLSPLPRGRVYRNLNRCGFTGHRLEPAWMTSSTRVS